MSKIPEIVKILNNLELDKEDYDKIINLLKKNHPFEKIRMGEILDVISDDIDIVKLPNKEYGKIFDLLCNQVRYEWDMLQDSCGSASASA